MPNAKATSPRRTVFSMVRGDPRTEVDGGVSAIFMKTVRAGQDKLHFTLCCAGAQTGKGVGLDSFPYFDQGGGMVRFLFLILGLVLGLGVAGCVATAQTPMAPLSVTSAPDLPSSPSPLREEKAEIYFDADSTIISAQSWKTLEMVAQFVRMNKNLEIKLVGRTDQKQNASLALRRAIAVRNALSQLGLNPERIQVQDEINSDTTLARQAPEKSKDAQKSRRVDIMIVPVFGDDV